MTQEFHPFPERTREIMKNAHTKRMEDVPVTEGGTKGKSAYHEAMERKRQRFQAGQGQGQQSPTAPNMPNPAQQHSQPMMYTAGDAPAPVAPTPQSRDKMTADRNKPLGPQLMAAVRAQHGLQSNVFHHGMQNAQPDPSVSLPVQAPPTMVAPRADSKAVSIDLPSKFVHYPFKDLYVSKMQGEHLEKFVKASEDESYQPVVEAVASLTNSTGRTGMYVRDSQDNLHEVPPAFYLTPQDFFYLMYYLRLNNFTRSKFIHTTNCQHEPHLEAVRSGQAKVESLVIETFVEKTNLKVINLETIPDPAQFPLTTTGLYLKPPQMIDVLEVMDAPEGLDAGTAMLMDLATYVQSFEQYLSIDERIEILRTLDLDDIETIQAYAAASNENYGVDEQIVVTCKECGASRKDSMSLDVHSFLPYK